LGETATAVEQVPAATPPANGAATAELTPENTQTE